MPVSTTPPDLGAPARVPAGEGSQRVNPLHPPKPGKVVGEPKPGRLTCEGLRRLLQQEALFVQDRGEELWVGSPEAARALQQVGGAAEEKWPPLAGIDSGPCRPPTSLQLLLSLT